MPTRQPDTKIRDRSISFRRLREYVFGGSEKPPSTQPNQYGEKNCPTLVAIGGRIFSAIAEMVRRMSVLIQSLLQRHGANDRQVISFSYTPHNKHTVCHDVPALRIPYKYILTKTTQRRGRYTPFVLEPSVVNVFSFCCFFLLSLFSPTCVTNERVVSQCSPPIVYCANAMPSGFFSFFFCSFAENLYLEYVCSYFHLMAMIWPPRIPPVVPSNRLKC